MTCVEIKELIDNGLGLRHCMLIRYLLDCGNSAYMYRIEEDTGLNRRFIERCLAKKQALFRKVLLSPVATGTRPHTIGVHLTPKGQQFSVYLTEKGTDTVKDVA